MATHRVRRHSPGDQRLTEQAGLSGIATRSSVLAGRLGNEAGGPRSGWKRTSIGCYPRDAAEFRMIDILSIIDRLVLILLVLGPSVDGRGRAGGVPLPNQLRGDRPQL